MDPRRFEALKASGRLPSPSGLAVAISDLLRRDDYLVEDVSHLVQSDPVIAGYILKFSNKAAYHQGRPFVSLSKAIFALGAFRVRDLVLGFSLLQSRNKVSCGDFDLEKFWSRSLAAAIANQELAAYVRIAAEENFTLGLLSGIGELSMATLFPDDYAGLAAQASNAGELLSLERKHFDIDHRELCSAFLSEWGIPEALIRVVYFHEQPEMVEFKEGSRLQTLTLSLHFARKLADLCLAREQQRWEMLSRLMTVGARLGIGSEELARLADRVVTQWREWGEMLKIQTSILPPFSEMLASPVFHDESASATGAVRILPLHRILLIGGYDENGLKRLLDGTGWDVMTSGYELAYQGEDPQIVVADLDLPKQEIVSFCRQVRARVPECYFIVMAKADAVTELSRAAASSIDDFLTKPVDANTFQMHLRNASRMLILKDEIRRERIGFMNSSDSWARGRRTLLRTATTDPLTQIPNRLHGEDFLSLEWTSARHSCRPLACLMLDIDHFKRINDRYGHAMGDAVLCQVVSIILGSLRSEDLAFRYGGEEFVIICPGANLQTAQHVGERIRQAVQNASFPGLESDVTLSAGVACARPSHHDYRDLLRDADEALYRAKQNGRNRVEA